jgi:PST family polysaccharide transporter
MESTPRTTFHRALLWAFVMIWGQRGVATLVTFLLAALLGPDAFGLVALAMIYVALVQIVLEQGLSAAIIQRRDLRPEHLDSAFWINLGLSGALAVGTIAVSGVIADANDMPELDGVLMALSLLLPIKGLTVVQEAVLRRALNFRALAIRGNAGMLVGGVVGVTAALFGAGVWALVAQQLVAAIVSLVLLWAIADWRPRMRFSREHARELLTFSLKVLFARIGVFLEGRIDAIVIGPFLGPAAVGLLRLAERAIDTITHVSAHPAALLSLPHLSRSQEDGKENRQELSRCIEAATILTFPAMVALAILADDLMSVLGEDWVAAAPALRLFCIAGALRAITVVVGQALQAAGRPMLYAILMWAITIISGVAFVMIAWNLRDQPIRDQIVGIAIWKSAITIAIVVPVSLLMIRAVTGYPVRDAVRAVLPSLAASAMVAATGLAALIFVRDTSWAPWLRLIVLAAVVGATLAGSIALLKPSIRRGVMERLRGDRSIDSIDPANSEPIVS